MAWNTRIQQEAKRNRLKGGLILSLTVFLGVSLFSYNPQDPSLNSFGLSLKVSNYCGFIGASLADLFYQMFGLSSWAFILGGCLLSYSFFINRFRESLLNSISFFALFLLSFTCLSQLYFSEISFFNHQVSLGGALGIVVVSSLKPLFHITGTAVILWSALALVFLFYSQTLFSSLVLFFPKKLLISFVRLLKKSPVLAVFIFSKVWKFYLIALSFLKKPFLSFKKLPVFVKRSFSKNHFPAETQDSLQMTDSSPASQSADESKNVHFSFKEDSLLNKEKNTSNKSAIKFSSKKQETNLSLKKEASTDDLPDKKQAEDRPIKKERAFVSVELPSPDILSASPLSSQKISRQDVQDLSKKLIDKLTQFSIQGEITAVKTGPAVVLFEFKPEDHVKVSRIREMESDLSLALSSESVRIIAPIPGRDVVGIEASRPYREMVYLKNLLQEEGFFKSTLPLILGRRADNLIGIRDLARIPHLLVAGTTGSGKSMFIISFITSLLFRHTPETLRILLIDPKQVDLSSFKGIPHLLSPIIISSNKAVGALHWAIMEMEKRYRSMALFGARDNTSFNEKVKNLNYTEKKQHEEKNEQASPQETYYFESLPLICIVIEEFGDLMADKNIRRPIENAVVRLAQKARASGIHLILAMQSPRKDVVTGLIKTNIPGRISFKVASGTDSRVILDEGGAEKLLSHGDMLFLEPGNPKPLRYHGPFVREKDVMEIGNYWRSQGEPSYEESLIKGAEKNHSIESINPGASDVKEESMYNEILDFVKTCDVVSASFLQRKFRIGYPRAARMIEVLFEEGWIGPPQGSKPREVLINK